MDTRETLSAKAAYTVAPQGVPRDMHAIAILRPFLTQEEII